MSVLTEKRSRDPGLGLLNLHCKYNYLDQLSLDCKLRRMYLSILIKTIIIIIIIKGSAGALPGEAFRNLQWTAISEQR